MNTNESLKSVGGNGSSTLDDSAIATLVIAFYDVVRADPVLGPIFNAHIHDWPSHLERMCAFWSSVMLMSRRYHGRPMEKHQVLDIDAKHFDRWLQLFRETAERLCEPSLAALFIERAHRIAESLELGRALHDGILLSRGERYRMGSVEA